jgi:hypothetical protein
MKKLALLALCFALLFCLTGCKSDDYEAAVALYDSGDYWEAQLAFEELGNYKDSAERAAAAEERRFIEKVTEELIEIEDLAATKIDGITYRFWDNTYALYLQIIEKDSEERAAIAARFKNALGDIEEQSFYIALNRYWSVSQLEEIVSHLETLGFSDKVEKLNKEITQYRYKSFYYERGEYEDLSYEQIAAQVALLFPDSEVKTIAEQALSFWMEIQPEGSLTRERAERALSLSGELYDIVDSLQDAQQPDYYLKNLLADIAHNISDKDIGYRLQSDKSMEENITPELEAYYADTSAGKAPIEITGNDLHIVRFIDKDTGSNFGTGILKLSIYSSNTRPHLNLRTASKPEEARYLINFSGTATYYATYYYGNTPVKTYSVNVTMYLKDCKTGDILFTQSFNAVPPDTIYLGTHQAGAKINVPEAYYADVSWDASVDEFTSVLLSTLGIE